MNQQTTQYQRRRHQTSSSKSSHSTSSGMVTTTTCLSFLLLLVTVVAAAAASSQQQPQQDSHPTTSRLPQRHRRTESAPRIVGGDHVNDPNRYPFFLEWEDALCGASLIYEDIALSAAHCENIEHPFDSRVFMLGTDSETGLLRTIERQVAHPFYTDDRQDYDYLILKLHSSALVDDSGNPTGAATIPLNRNPNVPSVGDALTAVGYGKTAQENHNTSPVLRDVEIYYISDDVCMDQYDEEDFVAEIMFCAGVPGGGKDTCQGDSGGPVIDQNTGTLVGAVSYGIGCAQADYAGVNARVSAVVEWIDSMICELSDNPPLSCGATNSNNNNHLPSGPGQLSITVTHDDYPEETAWAFTYLGPTPAGATAANVGATNVNPLGGAGLGYEHQIQIHFEPFHREGIEDRATVTESFTNLPVGRYSVQFGDSANDGICCSYGSGSMGVINDRTGAVVWGNGGSFGTYIEVIFDIDATGTITEVVEDYNYDNSWEAFTAINHPPTYDQEWPGAMPAADRSSVMVNVKFDMYNEETSWRFYSAVGGSWSLLRSFSGDDEGVSSDLVSVELNNLGSGWHRFRVEDTGFDGICCRHRRGWVSLTAPIITTRQRGLVWGNNGEFGSQIEVFVNIDSEGFVSQVSYTDPLATAATSRTAVRRRKGGDDRQRRRRHLLPSFTELPKEQLKRVPSP